MHNKRGIGGTVSIESPRSQLHAQILEEVHVALAFELVELPFFFFFFSSPLGDPLGVSPYEKGGTNLDNSAQPRPICIILQQGS